MKKLLHSKSALMHLRTSVGLFFIIASIVLLVMAFTQSPAKATRQSAADSINPALIPPGFDCAQIHSLGIDKQENLRAGAIMIYCGEAIGGSPDADEDEAAAPSFGQKLLEPLLGTTDEDLVTGTETFPHVTQSETFAAANPDNPDEIVIAYNDSRGVTSNPIDISSVSVSEDGGNTYTRVSKSNNMSPFTNTLGDPVALYNRPTATWFTVWLDGGSGGEGVGGYKSTTPSDPNSWTHFTVHTGSADDRESGWADNNPSSPFYGRMYVSFNDFNRDSGALFVRYSTDNGVTWTNERQLTTTFIRDVQITGDPTTGTVYLAAMDEMGGGLTNRQNKFFRSTDGGNTWTNTYNGPIFAGPGVTTCPSNSYFACMFQAPQGYWRHMGWGQPAALNGIVSYVYDARNTTTGDPANVFFIRSTDSGVTFSAPMQLNTDTTTRPNWQPNLSVAADGSLLSVWYDSRDTSTCKTGDPTVPCYQMWGRKSLDNGVTWQADQTFSDVISPLPGQPDSGIVTEYAGDYDYSSSVLNQHIHAWTDGRVTISNQSQQNTFADREPATAGGDNITLTAQHKKIRGVDTVRLTWSGASASQVDIYRNEVLLTTTANDGSFTDTPGAGSFDYHVCDTGTSTCSNDVTVNFRN